MARAMVAGTGVGLIWTFSTRAFTTQHTSQYIIPLLRWLFPHLEWETLLVIHQMIRKSPHFVEYFVFSLLILRGIRAGRKEAHLRWALAAIWIVACYAALDEFHQSSVPGRGPPSGTLCSTRRVAPRRN